MINLHLPYPIQGNPHNLIAFKQALANTQLPGLSRLNLKLNDKEPLLPPDLDTEQGFTQILIGDLNEDDAPNYHLYADEITSLGFYLPDPEDSDGGCPALTWIDIHAIDTIRVTL